MKALSLFFTGLVCLTLTARADVIVYKAKLAVTRSGDGQTVKGSLTGWAVLDTDFGELTFILLNKASGSYSIDDVSDTYEVGNVETGLNKSSTVFAIEGDGTGTIVCKGADVTLDVKGQTLWIVPRTMTVTGGDLETDPSDTFTEYKGSLAYDKLTTESSNLQGLMGEEVVELLEQKLIDLGYVEE